MMRGTSWLLALVVATAPGEKCGERARVAVVGGGPGGALTAILLARQERLDVTLIEKELEVRPWDKRSYPMALNDQGAAALGRREGGVPIVTGHSALRSETAKEARQLSAAEDRRGRAR